MPPVTFQRERAQDLWAEAQPLFVEHYREIAAFQDIPLAPDEARVFAAENAGLLRWYTVRADGALAGYALFVVNSHMHYATSRQAVQDVVFVSAPYRRGRLGLKLLQYADQALTAEGVDVVHHHVKVKHPALGRLLEHLGYQLTEHVFTKRLKKAA